MGGWIHRLDEWMDRLDGWTDGWIDRLGGWMYGWMDRLVTFRYPHLNVSGGEKTGFVHTQIFVCVYIYRGVCVHVCVYI